MQENTTVSGLLSGLDREGLDALCRSTAEQRDHKLSYGDADLWVTRALREAKLLGLDRSSPLDVLDIGMGPGYSLYVCQRLGHRCVGLDRPGHYPFWQDLRALLGITRIIEHTIKPYEQLPSMGRFDLVTSYRAQFNYNKTDKRLWNVDEWGFFLDDLRDNVLKPGGRFAIRLAKQEHKEGLKRTDVGLTEFLAHRGAVQMNSLFVFDPLR